MTLRSILQGAAWAVVFSAAATYIALKLGQGIESAIPISILAVGFSALLVRVLARRASTLLENVNVLAIGATSGIVAGGSVFTMPAVYILGLEDRSSFLQIFLVPLLGAVLGVFLLAPFRRYFVRDLHGKLPYPEARATTEILVAGKRGGHSALVLTWSALLAAVFDFVGPSMKGWAENFSTAAITGLSGFTERTKAVFTMNTSAAVFGLGYIMGLDYAAIIMAGSMALVMLFFMRHMYKSTRKNAAIIVGSVALMALGLWLVRSQSTVNDVAWMKAMIPHHSIAILTSERATIADPRARKLAGEIIQTQKREIAEMEALIRDLESARK